MSLPPFPPRLDQLPQVLQRWLSDLWYWLRDNSGGGGSGTVTNIATTAPITGGPITTTGTLGIDAFTGDSGSGGAKGAVPAPAVGDATKFLKGDGTWASAGGGSGTVTSVAQTVPAEFSITGSPITGAGTLAIDKATQSANTVWAGPNSGSAAQPAFRALTMADLPIVWLFGNGADGSFTADGVATPAWATLAGSVYTMTRSAALTTLTINAGITIQTAGYILFCSAELANQGIVGAAGGNAVKQTPGAAGGSGSSLTAFYLGGTTGGSGGGGGTAGGVSTGCTVCISGRGGSGGTASAAGGTAGTVAIPSLLQGGIQFPYTVSVCMKARTPDGIRYQGGTGGGGGGSFAISSLGGGGGGGGGIAGIFAKTISGSGVITVAGGNGDSGSNTAGGGGGGGGGGGLLFLITETVNYASLNTVTAAGGLHGLGVGGAANGADGAAGAIVAAII